MGIGRQHDLYCILSFLWHKCSQNESNNNIYFHAEAKCLNFSCTNFKFVAQERILNPFADFDVIVLQTGVISHADGEVHKRFIRKKKREMKWKKFLLKC